MVTLSGKSDIRIRVRRDRRGGLLDQQHLATRAAHRDHAFLVLLVHGFNTNEDEAAKSYARFENELKKWSGSLVRNHVGRFFWTGDWRAPLLRGLGYPKIVPIARESGYLLAEYLSDVQSPGGGSPKIVLIGHSLGCRVILEAIDNLSRMGSTHCITAILMAAAVPVDYAFGGGRLENAIHFTKHSYVLWSSDDGILREWFRLGQKLTRGESSAEAVGLFGRPRRRVWADRQRMTGYDHGSYWKGKRSAAQVARWLGLSVPRAAFLRALPKSRKLKEWTIPSRPSP